MKEYLLLRKDNKRIQKYSIKKLSVGVSSVLVGTVYFGVIQ